MDEDTPLLGVQNETTTSDKNSISGSIQNELQTRVPYHERKPFTRKSPLQRHNPRSLGSVERSATYNRYKYYSMLDKDQERMMIPEHVLPNELFLVTTKYRDGLGNQSSWVTILSLWNSMVGTSLLSMPWAINQAGFACGIFIMLLIAGLSFHTARLIVQFTSCFSAKERKTLEFSDICRTYLGRWGDWAAFVFSLSALFGTLIVFYILMSNFLYNAGHFIYETVNPINITTGNSSTEEVLCPSGDSAPAASRHADFYKYWDQQGTVPFFLIAIVFPLINIKSPTFFTRFNALGTLSVLYVTFFTIYKCAFWGINIEFTDGTSTHMIEQAKVSFPALSGTLTLAFFVHNAIPSITRYQKHPKNNDRDIFVAYILVTITYSLVGFLFYVTFPLEKSCIEQVLLQNFLSSDGMALGVRLILLFQLSTVFPLLAYVLRVQVMNFMFGKSYPSCVHIFVLNILLMVLCTVFASFYPHVGKIIRFTGALCGLAYIYTLPPVIHLLESKRKGKLTKASLFMHVCIVGFGILNFVAQIAITFA